MSYLLKSRFVREELQRWALALILLMWAVTATAWAVSKESKTLIIGVSDEATYVVSDERSKKQEIITFAKDFLLSYYQFSPESFATQVTHAGDLMSAGLWESKKTELFGFSEKLKKDPLTQNAKIISIEMIDENRMEALLELSVLRKLEKVQAKIKVKFEIEKKPRTESNPWPYQVTELKDASL